MLEPVVVVGSGVVIGAAPVLDVAEAGESRTNSIRCLRIFMPSFMCRNHLRVKSVCEDISTLNTRQVWAGCSRHMAHLQISMPQLANIMSNFAEKSSCVCAQIRVSRQGQHDMRNFICAHTHAHTLSLCIHVSISGTGGKQSGSYPVWW